MNTFFTVWFLVSGSWIANVQDGWQGYNKGTEEACKASVTWAYANPAESAGAPGKIMFTCENNDKPMKRSQS